MNFGFVVEQSESEALVHVNLLSLVIPVKSAITSDQLKIGTRVCVLLRNSNTEIASLTVQSAFEKITVTGNELRIFVRFIFPPRKLLSKIGLKLYSDSIGIFSADESKRILFEMAADVKLVVYEGLIKWCRSSREFVLDDNQQLTPLGNDSLFPSYLKILKESPWADLIEAPKTADEVLQNVMNDMIPSSSSSDDDHDAIPSDFARTGVLMEKLHGRMDEWKVFILDASEPRNQWTTLTERRLHRHSTRPYQGATIEIDLNTDVNFKVEQWCVVDPDNSVIVTKAPSGVTVLDVAVRAEKIVRIGERSVTRLHNKRVLDVYDYHNQLGKVNTGQVLRVIIKWSQLEGDYIKGRYEWVVSGYGKGEPVLPESKSEIRRRKEISQALEEFRFAEYATDGRDWNSNQMLRKYKRVLEESKREDERREEERLRKREEEKKDAEMESSPISQSALVIRTDGQTFKIWMASLGVSIDQSKDEVPEGTKEGDWLSLELDDRGMITQIKESSALLPSSQPDGRDELKVWDWFIVESRYRKAYSHSLGFIHLSPDFIVPKKEELDRLSFNLFAVVRGDRLVIPMQSICVREGDEERRVIIAKQLRIEFWNSPDIKHFENDILKKSEFKIQNGREISDWMPILINGTYQTLYFFSSRVGDGIIVPSLYNANSSIKIGAVFEAKIEKLAATPRNPRIRYEVVNLSPLPIELPMGVTVEMKGNDIQVTTIVEVEKEGHKYFLLSCDLIGKCFIPKPDVFRDRPIFIGQRIRVFTRRIQNGPTSKGSNHQPSHWKVFRYEHLGEVERGKTSDKENRPAISMQVSNRGVGNGSIQGRGIQRNVRNFSTFGSTRRIDSVKNDEKTTMGERRSLPSMSSGTSEVKSEMNRGGQSKSMDGLSDRMIEMKTESNEHRQSPNEQNAMRPRTKSPRGRVTSIMSRLILHPEVAAAIQRNDRRRGTTSYQRIIELLK